MFERLRRWLWHEDVYSPTMNNLLAPGLRQKAYNTKCKHGQPLMLLSQPMSKGIKVFIGYHVTHWIIPEEWFLEDKYDEMYKLIENAATRCEG